MGVREREAYWAQGARGCIPRFGGGSQRLTRLVLCLLSLLPHLTTTHKTRDTRQQDNNNNPIPPPPPPRWDVGRSVSVKIAASTPPSPLMDLHYTHNRPTTDPLFFCSVALHLQEPPPLPCAHDPHCLSLSCTAHATAVQYPPLPLSAPWGPKLVQHKGGSPPPPPAQELWGTTACRCTGLPPSRPWGPSSWCTAHGRTYHRRNWTHSKAVGLRLRRDEKRVVGGARPTTAGASTHQYTGLHTPQQYYRGLDTPLHRGGRAFNFGAKGSIQPSG